MNKQLTWFLVAIIWAMVAVINSVQHRSPYLVTYNVLAAILFAALGLLQPYCRKRGSERETVADSAGNRSAIQRKNFSRYSRSVSAVVFQKKSRFPSLTSET